MAVVVYPTDLPQFTQLQGSEQLPDNLVQTEMDMGPRQTRRRSTLAFSTLQVPFTVTTTVKDAIKDFYTDTLADGSLEFQKVDFFEEGGTSFIYKFQSPPSFTWIGSNVWTTTFNLYKIREA